MLSLIHIWGIELADIEINKSDIDEVNDVIQETDEEAYALDSEFTEAVSYTHLFPAKGFVRKFADGIYHQKEIGKHEY